MTFVVVYLTVNRNVRIQQRLNTVAVKLTTQLEITNSFLKYPG